MFPIMSPVAVMAMTIRMTLSVCEAQRLMALQMLAMAGAMASMGRAPAEPAKGAEPPAVTQISAAPRRRAAAARR
jgi:hypothetical protein